MSTFGSSVLGADWYVDSVAGNDANTGKLDAGNTPQPLLTIAALSAKTILANQVIALKCGSTWREMFTAPVDGLQILGYGSGDPPVLDGADVVSPGAFTLSSAPGNGGVVYQFNWTRGAGVLGGTDTPLFWENAVEASQTASVAACAALAGSYYVPNPEDATSIIYVHPTGSTNPISDGKTYEVTIRGAGIYAYTRTGIKVAGVRCRRSWNHYGPLSPGPSQITRQCIVDGGGIHHIVAGSGYIEDSCLLEFQPSMNGGGCIPIAIYQPLGSGVPVSRRVFSIGAAATKSVQGSLYCHTAGVVPWDSVYYEQCYGSYGGGFGGEFSAAGALTQQGCFHDSGTGSGLGGNYSILHGLLKNCSGLAGTNAMLSDAGPLNTVNCTRVIENTVIYCTGASGAGYGIRVDGRQGTLTIRNCILVVSDSSSAIGLTLIRSNGVSGPLTVTIQNCIFAFIDIPGIDLEDSHITYVGDHNLFYRTPSGSAQIPFKWQGTYMETLPTWQAASGQDLHSARLTNAQWAALWLGTRANGDFRINPSAAVTGGNGTVYTGTFPDGVAISTVGPQEHWDWNAKGPVSGPPTAWPAVPASMADAKAYIANPAGWAF